METNLAANGDFLVYEGANNTWTHKSLTSINQIRSIRIVSSNVTTLSTDYTLLANCVSSNVHITLSNVNSKILNIKKIDSSNNVVVLNGIVDGQNNTTIINQYDSVTIHNLSGVWYKIS